MSFRSTKVHVFLGHEISRDGIKPPSNKVEFIVNYSSPKNVKELRRIMGLFNWFRKIHSQLQYHSSTNSEANKEKYEVCLDK